MEDQFRSLGVNMGRLLVVDSPLVPPTAIVVKINVDTDYFRPRNKVSSGIIIWDYIGQILRSGYRIHTWLLQLVWRRLYMVYSLFKK
ncbi:hypothetical protein PVK06_028037 [Gossypium arboreum]|uniref:Uncharacterized protein n=1 Tax=Gossypium arboreum TaxID=29729 RepID=A0ABR0P1U8_GOSAR|nr:hypothetical protein PVK06_028037 [Gossypium arboreum]